MKRTIASLVMVAAVTAIVAAPSPSRPQLVTQVGAATSSTSSKIPVPSPVSSEPTATVPVDAPEPIPTETDVPSTTTAPVEVPPVESTSDVAVPDDVTVIPPVTDTPPPVDTPSLCEQARPGARCPGDGPQPADVVHSDYYNSAEDGVYCPPDGASWANTIWVVTLGAPDTWPVPGVDCDPSLPVVVFDVPGWSASSSA